MRTGHRARPLMVGNHDDARVRTLHGQAEIQQLDALPADQDVRGFQIAVGDALPVRGVQRGKDLARIRSRAVPSRFSRVSRAFHPPIPPTPMDARRS